tara:strand:+ start:292 stop:765 length:474 start_codon:yes stop_codon:yes gene_type:complete
MALLACGQDAESMDALIQRAQETSFMGPTTYANFQDRTSLTEFQEKRDRAYAFCIKTYSLVSDRSRCFDQQHLSIFAERRALNYVDIIKRNGLTMGDYEFGPGSPEWYVFHDGQNWKNAKEYCYSVYSDGGENDARALGPCLSAALGSDFFGMVGVP